MDKTSLRSAARWLGFGAGVAAATYGTYVVATWLAGIIVNLLLVQNYYDIALRDLGLCLGALALGRLAGGFDRRRSYE